MGRVPPVDHNPWLAVPNAAHHAGQALLRRARKAHAAGDGLSNEGNDLRRTDRCTARRSIAGETICS